MLAKSNGRLAFRFHARDLHLVLKPEKPGDSVAFRVSLDGKSPQASHGVDIDEQGNGTVIEARLYQLIRQSEAVADRVFEIEFFNSGAEVYVFTFG